MKFSLARMLVITAWFCLVLWFARLNGCDYQGIKDAIEDGTYTPEESEAWWKGWHDWNRKDNPYQLTSGNDLWKCYNNGSSARDVATIASVFVLTGLFAVACFIPLQRKKFVHDWQI